MRIRARQKLTVYDLKKETIYRITTTITGVSPVGATAAPMYPSTSMVVEDGAIPVGAGALAGAGAIQATDGAGAAAGAGAIQATAGAGAGAIPVGAGATQGMVGAIQAMVGDIPAMDGAIPTTEMPDMSIAAEAITIVITTSMPSEAVR